MARGIGAGGSNRVKARPARQRLRIVSQPALNLCQRSGNFGTVLSPG